MSAPPSRPSPYQGLTAFDEHDAPYFFGREKDSRLIAADLFAAPVTVLYGGSGVGKSSVLRAGVVPLLRPRTDVLIVVFGAWQSDPLSGLKGAIAQAVLATSTPGEEAYNRYQDSIVRIQYEPLPQYLSSCAALVKRRLMIVLDQFEEYSLYHPQDDEFARQFPAATRLGDVSVSFLLSMREEAVARLDRFEGRIPTLFDNYRRIDHLDFVAGRAAIERPIARYNEDATAAGTSPMSIEPALVDLVLEDVQAGKVQIGDTGRAVTAETTGDRQRIEAPYLQLVMTRLWNEERRLNWPTLRLETFRRLGRAERIVRTHLDDVMARLSEPQRDTAARVFQLLVTPSGTKIAHTVRDLALTAVVDPVELAHILEALSAGTDRILRPVAALPEHPDEPRYEIFHDRLANAVLDWRARFLKEKEVTEVKQQDFARRGTTIVTTESELPSTVPSAVRGVNAPPLRLIAELLRPRPRPRGDRSRPPIVVLVGSGVSASDRPVDQWHYGAPFPPTGWELTQLLGKEIDFPADDLRASSLSEVASYYQFMAGRNQLQKRLHEVFASASTPTPTHRLLARVAATTPLSIFASTLDALTERAFDDADIPYHLVINSIDVARGSVLWRKPRGKGSAEGFVAIFSPREVIIEPGESVIYKLFGSVIPQQPELDSFVVTEEDEMELFGQFHAGSLPPPQVAHTLFGLPALFLGMSLRSWTQRLVLNQIRRQSNRDQPGGWAIVRNVSPLEEWRWKFADIKVFDIDIREFTAGLEAELESS